MAILKSATGNSVFEKEEIVIINFKVILNRYNIRKQVIPVSLIVVVLILSSIVYLQRKPITLEIDGQAKQVVTYKSTVEEALKGQNITISPKDKVVPNLQAKIKKNDKILIKRAVTVAVAVDGKNLTFQSAEPTIDSLLKAEGIQYKPEDKIQPSKETPLSAGLKVDITRVETKTLTETVPIDFKTIVKNDSNLPNTKKQTIQDGKNGEKNITTSVTYENGKEVARKVVSEKITKKPLDKIVVLGTLPVLPISRGGEAIAYTKLIKATATAYSGKGGTGNTYTASGRRAVRDSNGYSTVAVDPRVIPLGTRLFIEGYGFAVAADTGTGVLGNTIDVYFNTYNEACSWGVRGVNVYILK